MVINNIDITKNKVVVWGVGKICKTGLNILKELDVNVDYFCDSNPDLWGHEIENGVMCYSFEELCKEEGLFYFVMVGIKNEKVIFEQLKRYNLSYIGFNELIKLDEVIFKCFGNSDVGNGIVELPNTLNKKCVIYTCITGGYDIVNEPEYIDSDFDYVIISDDKPKAQSLWKWVDANEVIPQHIIDNTRRNRYCKINGSKIFKNYKYSIYIDGNFKITGDIKWMLGRISQSGVALFKHPQRDCIYSEALACIAAGYGNLEGIKRQMNRYLLEGMPLKFGMFECGVMLRENENKICNNLMTLWWNEVEKYSYRDQLSIMYCVWKLKMTKEDIGLLGENNRKTNGLELMLVHFGEHV
jgi:hypothetical protein